MTRYKFTEADKTSKILKHPTLSDEQKEELIEFFKTHNDQHNLIDWNRFNKMEYAEIRAIIETWERTHLLPQRKLSDLKSGKDYEYLGEEDDYKYYFIYTYEASVAFASNNIGPEVWSPLCDWYIKNEGGEETNWEQNVLYDFPQKELDGGITYGGAKWCISMNHTQRYWKKYRDNDKDFVFAIRNSSSEKDKRNKYAIEFRAEYDEDEEKRIRVLGFVYNSWDIRDSFGSIVGDTLLHNPEMEKKLKVCFEHADTLRNERILNTDKELFTQRTRGREIKQFAYKGCDFPMVEMGSRPEGKVFGSYYLTVDFVPFSPMYEGGKYIHSCNRWDISILRQWLNSDKPAGEWFTPSSFIEDSKTLSLCKYRTPSETLAFINNTDGFLKILGISKSQLNPVQNITYTREGEESVTEDYVWIPSLTELSTVSIYKEGECLDYWKELLGENAGFESEENNRIMHSSDDYKPHSYITRSICSKSYNGLWHVDSRGHIESMVAESDFKVPVLMCFKS